MLIIGKKFPDYPDGPRRVRSSKKSYSPQPEQVAALNTTSEAKSALADVQQSGQELAINEGIAANPYAEPLTPKEVEPSVSFGNTEASHIISKELGESPSNAVPAALEKASDDHLARRDQVGPKEEAPVNEAREVREDSLHLEYKKLVNEVVQDFLTSFVLKGLFLALSGKTTFCASSLPTSPPHKPGINWIKFLIALLLSYQIVLAKATKLDLGLFLKTLFALILLYYTILDTDFLQILYEVLRLAVKWSYKGNSNTPEE